MARRIPDCHNLAQVNKLMIDIAQEIKEVTDELAALEDQAAAKRAHVDRQENVAFLKATGAMDLRKQEAEAVAWDEGEADARAYEAAMRSRRHRLAGLHAELDVVTKIGANIKADMRAFDPTVS